MRVGNVVWRHASPADTHRRSRVCCLDQTSLCARAPASQAASSDAPCSPWLLNWLVTKNYKTSQEATTSNVLYVLLGKILVDKSQQLLILYTHETMASATQTTVFRISISKKMGANPERWGPLGMLVQVMSQGIAMPVTRRLRRYTYCRYTYCNVHWRFENWLRGNFVTNKRCEHCLADVICNLTAFIMHFIFVFSIMTSMPLHLLILSCQKH